MKYQTTPCLTVIDLFQLENEGAEEQEIAARIYDYIVKFWASPYVVIDEFLAANLDPKPYPFSGEVHKHAVYIGAVQKTLHSYNQHFCSCVSLCIYFVIE